MGPNRDKEANFMLAGERKRSCIQTGQRRQVERHQGDSRDPQRNAAIDNY